MYLERGGSWSVEQCRYWDDDYHMYQHALLRRRLCQGDQQPDGYWVQKQKYRHLKHWLTPQHVTPDQLRAAWRSQELSLESLILQSRVNTCLWVMEQHCQILKSHTSPQWSNNTGVRESYWSSSAQLNINNNIVSDDQDSGELAPAWHVILP